jgi:hypothetical protein
MLRFVATPSGSTEGGLDCAAAGSFRADDGAAGASASTDADGLTVEGGPAGRDVRLRRLDRPFLIVNLAC